MGNFLSSSEAFVEVAQMDSKMEIDFQFSQMRQWEAVKAAGQQQELAQIANVGGLGGGGGGLSAATPWGNTPSVWLGVSNFFAMLAILVVPASIAFAIAAFLAKLGRSSAFASVFLACTFAGAWFMYNTMWGRSISTTPMLFVYALAFGLLGGGVAAALYSEPAVQAAAAQVQQPQVLKPPAMPTL
jgi:K+-transporting ATPase A subunit